MDFLHSNLCVVIVILLFLNTSNVQGRYHYHKKQKPKEAPVLPSLVSQSPPPVPSDPNTDPPPVSLEPNDPGNSTSNCIFDVVSFGAVGYGTTDDTEAFRNAWKAACAVESAVVLAHADYTFMITSSVFYGPCKPGLIFQVDGVLMLPNGPDCWPKKDSNKQWLVFYRLDDMTFTGIGTIERNGQQWWELPCKPHRACWALLLFWAAVQTETDYATNVVNPWRLYTVTQVEELKAIIRLLPVWASRIVFTTVYSQMSTMFVLQGNTLEQHIGPNFKIPSASLSLFDTLSVLFWAPVYDSFLIPLAKSLLAMKEASLSSKEWALVLLSL